MRYIKIDKNIIEAEISALEAVLSKVDLDTPGLMFTPVYATRNAYRKILNMDVLKEKKKTETKQQLDLGL